MPWTLTWDDDGGQHERVLQRYEELGDLVREMDGGKRSLVECIDDDAHAAVGGAAESGVIAYVTFDGSRFHQLIDASNGDDEVTVVAGGQSGIYRRREIVSVDVAVRAVSTFVRERLLDSDLSWETRTD